MSCCDPKCQIQGLISKQPYFDYMGRAYCRFHLPFEASSWRDSSFQADSLSLLNGTIFPTACDGPATKVDLSGLNLPGGEYRLYDNLVDNPHTSVSSICFDRSTFIERVSTNEINIPVSFNDSNFRDGFECNGFIASEIMFRRAEFHGRGIDLSVPRVSAAPIGYHSRNIRDIDFSEAWFNSPSNFGNRNFTSKASFNKATFVEAPVFYDCNFSHDVSFHGVKCNSAKVEDEGRYRCLRTMMGELSSRNDEGLFFSYEERCKRKNHNNWLSLASIIRRFTSWLYDKTSEYGRNYALVLMRIIYFQIGFFILYLVVAELNSPLNSDVLLSLVKFTFTQLVRPFDLFSAKSVLPSYFNCIGAWPKLTLYFGTILHSLSTLILVPLFLLALRWQFKKD